MTRRFGLTLLLALAATAVAIPVRAELSPRYVEWGNGPFQFLLTEAEAAQWSAISDDAAAEAFIRMFWARRDPDPQTPENEARLEFERRVAFADQRWTHEDESEGVTVRGAMTDRGRVFLLLGPPRRMQAPGSERSAQGGDTGLGTSSPTDRTITSGAGPGKFGTGGTTDRVGGASEEQWIYEGDEKPEFIKSRRLTVTFRAAAGDDPEMKLYNPERVLASLAEAVERAVLHPGLTLADLPAAPAGLSLGDRAKGGWGLAALDSEAPLEALRARLSGQAPVADDFRLDAHVFEASDGTWIVPFQVATAAGSEAGGAVVGELIDAGGESVLGFRSDQGWQQSTDQRVVQATVIAPPGRYELRIGVEGPDGTVVWGRSQAIEVPEGVDGLWLSDLLLAEDIHPLEQAQGMYEPYRWQGVAVVPRGDRRFVQGRSLWFYVHVCGAQLAANGDPDLKVVATLTGPKRFRGPLQALPAKVGDECWVIAQALDLPADKFPEGDYELGLQVRDAVSGDVRTTGNAAFRVVTAP
ncbi:MAG TPA: GWxTD domain-containing protein [Thermoanaerobaculia bacterium]|nr:GWxTD domain-containing protein [Thermoanaerobaculia bacterium]